MTSSCLHFVAHAHVRTRQKWPVQLAQSLTIRHVDNIRLKRDTCHLRVDWHMGEEDTVGDARRDLDERREREKGILQVLASLIRRDHLCHKGKNGV